VPEHIMGPDVPTYSFDVSLIHRRDSYSPLAPQNITILSSASVESNSTLTATNLPLLPNCQRTKSLEFRLQAVLPVSKFKSQISILHLRPARWIDTPPIHHPPPIAKRGLWWIGPLRIHHQEYWPPSKVCRRISSPWKRPGGTWRLSARSLPVSVH